MFFVGLWQNKCFVSLNMISECLIFSGKPFQTFEPWCPIGQKYVGLLNGSRMSVVYDKNVNYYCTQTYFEILMVQYVSKMYT